MGATSIGWSGEAGRRELVRWAVPFPTSRRRPMGTAPDSGYQLRPVAVGRLAGGFGWAKWTPEARHGRQSPPPQRGEWDREPPGGVFWSGVSTGSLRSG